MAHERSISRHGGYDSFRGTQVEDANPAYQKQSLRPNSSRPMSSRRTRTSQSIDYDNYARDPQSQGIERNGHSPIDRLTSPTSSIGGYSRHDSMESSVSSSYRPPSRSSGSSMSNHLGGDPRATPEPSSRPSSSLSRYTPLPGIGQPHSLSDSWNIHHTEAHLYNDNHSPPVLPHPPVSSSQEHWPNIQEPPSRNSASRAHRIPSAVSDISVISSKASSRRTSTDDTSATAHQVERLDLSQLKQPTENGGRRRRSGNHSSPAHRPKSSASASTTTTAALTQNDMKYDSGELYDGDDDDSDSNHGALVDSREPRNSSAAGGRANSAITSCREPVVIPSENRLASAKPDQSILLAVKLPTDSSTHQRFFQRSDTLMAIVEFAEEQAGQDFANYVLVSSPPKKRYEALQKTIEDEGIQDTTLLHLEERD